ncbi:MAG: DnaA/Hda family protein [Thermoplasmata archaeon]
MARAEFPTGIKIQEKKGAGKLKPLLSKLKKYAFNGYIHVMVDETEGYIILMKGMPRNALLYLPGHEEIEGLDALQKIQDLESMDDFKIKVHTNVDIDHLISSAKGRIIGGGEEHIEEAEQGELTEHVEDETDKDEETRRNTIREEMKKAEIGEREINVYDILIKERKGIPRTEPGTFPKKYTFENFIVGPNNKFAYSAALEICKAIGGNFNPLFITSPSGLGKTHLLKSMGYYTLENNPNMKVEYTTAMNLSLLLHKEEGALKGKFQDIDLFLLDDIQFLANHPELQEKVDHIFQMILDKAGQIVIASNRAPEEIPLLRNRLLTRFKAGLIVEVKPPVFETRRYIIKKIIERYQADLSDEVVDFIAECVDKNVRELEGALNRILAFSTLFDEDITLDGVRESISPYIDDSKDQAPKNYSFLSGRSYLIETKETDLGFEMLTHNSDDRKVFIFSRMNPKRIQEDFGLADADIFWLTGRESDMFKTVPPNLEGLTWHLEEVMPENPIILLDGIEYLIGQTGFNATIQFMRHIIDVVSESKTIFLLIVSPEALEKKQISILEREMEVAYE